MMHPNPSILLALAALGFSSSLVFAQDKPPVKPSPPYVRGLSGNVSLVESFTYKTVAPDANQTQERKDFLAFYHSRFPTPAEFDATISGNLRRDKLSYTNGLTIDTWRVGQFRLQTYSTSPDSISVLVASPTGYEDKPDFQELSWITGETYKGEQSFQGKPCYVYTLNDQTALIYKATRFPASYDSKTMQISFTYHEQDVPLRLPDKFAQKLQQVTRPPGSTSP